MKNFRLSKWENILERVLSERKVFLKELENSQRNKKNLKHSPRKKHEKYFTVSENNMRFFKLEKKFVTEKF